MFYILQILLCYLGTAETVQQITRIFLCTLFAMHCCLNNQDEGEYSLTVRNVLVPYQLVKYIFYIGEVEK